MECAVAVLALAVLVALPLAIAAYRRSRANRAGLAAVTAEVARLRALLEGVPAAARGVQAEVPATAPVAAPHAAPVPAAALAAPVTLLETAPRASIGGAVGGDGVRASAARVPSTTVAGPATAAPISGPPPKAPMAARHSSFEELIGGRLLLWIGSAALALAGAFLVKISFERGWISPSVRVTLGIAFGIALLTLSEVLRRGEDHRRRQAPVAARGVSEALAAAGIADLFACFLAAVHVYHLVAPAAGFGLMALTAAVAVVLSLRQGVMVALIGLVGGFLTPALIQTGHPSARNLFGYLLLLIGGLLAVARRRGWPWLGYAAMAAGLLWAAVWLGGLFQGGDAPWLSLFLIAVAVAATLPWFTAAANTSAGDATAFPEATSGFALGPAGMVAITGTLALLAGTVARSGYSASEWGFLGLLAAAVLAVAWLDPRQLPLAWITGAVLAMLLASWGRQLTAADSSRFLLTALAAGGLFALAGWAAALAESPRWPPRSLQPLQPLQSARSPEPPPPDRGTWPAGTWAALSSSSGVIFFLVAWGAAHALAGLRPETWGGLALALAAIYLAGAVPVARRRARRAELGTALAALAVAVTSLVSVAVPLALGRESLAVAWALEVTALAALAGRFRLPVLMTLARLLTVAAVAGALLSGVDRAGSEPLLTPLTLDLLYVYGVPLLALAAAARLAHRAGARATELEWAAVVLGFSLLTREVHQVFQPWSTAAAAASFRSRFPAASSSDIGLGEAAALAASWIVLGWGLLRGNLRRREPQLPSLRSLEVAGRLIGVLGLVAAVLGPGVVMNPWWNHEAVGSRPLINLLPFAYALPALLAVAAAAEVRRRGGRRLPRLAGLAALLLGFAYITLEVRHLFHGTFLDEGAAGAAERYAYSAAWVLYGVALLLAGIVRHGAILRYASLAVMLLAVLKVFLYDTANLSDLFRVLSFLGLGASLLLLAFLYQRFVFRESGA